ncbi:hypothetical protein [Archangium gephyra]|uniref:hypothetical protein n=1 Tax=Archangium gephyra TaxID=48 RepID=UPI0011C0E9CD|nr:hypothetical protein [Archangium gephyra]
MLIVTDDWVGVVNGGFLTWPDQPLPDRIDPPQAREFHLGEFMRVLQETAWVGFSVELTRAHRTRPSGNITATQLAQDRGADVVGFRFDESFSLKGETRKLSDYDLVLFFPISPAQDDSEDKLKKEAEAIAQFMENGGGFFATGDHANLGAPLCKLIPRVRSMRRWYAVNPGPQGEPVSPSPTSADRHDTTRPGPDGQILFENQSDEVAQEIEPTWYPGGFAVKAGYPARVKYPHPLLCSPLGAVTYLPDHMHEGWCEVPDKLAGRTFTLGPQTLPEYPVHGPNNEPLAPELVANGTVLPGHSTPVIDQEHAAALPLTVGKTFGVICAWDGHRVDKGRVVVDSTWHHFFNINLVGDMYLADEQEVSANDQRLFGFFVLEPGSAGRVPNEQYKMIEWYFRNLVYWLIPAKRMHSIAWHSMVQLTLRPRLLEELQPSALEGYTFKHFYYLGQLAEEYLQKARGACAVYEVKRILFHPKIPPWEWVEDLIDIWDPVPKPSELPQMSLAGLLGAGPKPEVLIKTVLGSAVLAAAQLRDRVASRADDRVIAELEALFPRVLQHALTQLGRELDIGRRAFELLQRTIREPLPR